ncbi:S-protein homolog 19-like [Solanum dulcamara]|uniref:S-protein homolog 19-like n=1 Tax=Solanum dulcamara TaxID=45834 RepID=UPI0024865817|nr:S-protein homolog 19-like [Solanum dulcamara]
MVHLLVKFLFLLFIMPYNIEGCEPEVHIHNDVPQNSPQLEFHCASGDDDLGYHYPSVGSDFNWSFCASPVTLFFCHFWWNGKNIRIDVFDQLGGCVGDAKRGSVPNYTVKCHWQVKDDGIYLGYFDTDVDQLVFTKYRDW